MHEDLNIVTVLEKNDFFLFSRSKMMQDFINMSFLKYKYIFSSKKFFQYIAKNSLFSFVLSAAKFEFPQFVSVKRSRRTANLWAIFNF